MKRGQKTQLQASFLNLLCRYPIGQIFNRSAFMNTVGKYMLGEYLHCLVEDGFLVKHKMGMGSPDSYARIKDIPENYVIRLRPRNRQKTPPTSKRTDPLSPAEILQSAQLLYDRIQEREEYVQELEEKYLKLEEDHRDLQSWVNRTLKMVPPSKSFRVERVRDE